LNPGHRLAVPTFFEFIQPFESRWRPKIYLYVALLASRLLRWLLEFWKIYAPLRRNLRNEVFVTGKIHVAVLKILMWAIPLCIYQYM
jgi:hypothetical protein